MTQDARLPPNGRATSQSFTSPPISDAVSEEAEGEQNVQRVLSHIGIPLVEPGFAIRQAREQRNKKREEARLRAEEARLEAAEAHRNRWLADLGADMSMATTANTPDQPFYHSPYPPNIEIRPPPFIAQVPMHAADDIKDLRRDVSGLQQTVLSFGQAITALQQTMQTLYPTVQAIQQRMQWDQHAVQSQQQVIEDHAKTHQCLQETVQAQNTIALHCEQTMNAHQEALESHQQRNMELQLAILKLQRALRRLGCVDEL